MRQRLFQEARRRGRKVVLALLGVYCLLFAFHLLKPLPDGIAVSGPLRDATGMEFLVDLTYQREGRTVAEQRIFDRVFSMIDAAEEFVVLDMFLFNDEHGGERDYRPLSSELTRRLVARKTSHPDLAVTFITDDINNFYGVYVSDEIARLQEAGVRVVITRLSRLRDSNPAYSAAWRIFAKWSGSAGPGWLPHPLSSTGRKVTARSYLKLLNFKANHRKLLITERECLVTSGNPHDASSFHSNIAFVGEGPLCSDLLASERAVAAFSGGFGQEWPTYPSIAGSDSVVPGEAREAGGPVGGQGSVQLVTEGKILDALLGDIGSAGAGDRVDLAMFYVSERRVVNALLGADRRGASVRLILDPNKDAFGREKGGVPNRQVAGELVRRSHGRIAVRWYDTRGEQFHTKLVMVTRGDTVTVTGGSANLTRRNLGDYNLETNLRLVLPLAADISVEVAQYFQRLFSDEGGNHTLPFDAFQDDRLLKRALYRVQELTGLSSF